MTVESEKNNGNKENSGTEAKDGSGNSAFKEDASGLLLSEHPTVTSLEKIYQVFAASTKRWETIVYPAILAFMILAGYGFYLIYSLTSDVGKVTEQMKVVSSSMLTISGDIHTMSNSVVNMNLSVQGMQQTLAKQLTEMQKFNTSMNEMNHSVRIMSASMNQMRLDMGMMNRNVSRPMNFMNSFMPW